MSLTGGNMAYSGARGELLFYAKIPVADHFSKKNSNRFNTNTGRTYRDSRSNQIETHLMRELRRNAIDQKINEPIRCHMHAMFLFYFSNFFTKKSLKATRKNPKPIPERNQNVPDQSNLYQGVEDCLQKIGIIEDDNLIESHDGSRRLPGDTNCIEIFIYRYENVS